MRVLIVEDNLDLSMMISSMLQEQGFKVKQVATFDGCFDAINTFVPDVVLLDLSLPDSQEPEETLQRFFDAFDHRVPVIAVSGTSIGADKCLDHGCMELLIKARFQIEDIPDAIKYAVARHRVIRALNAQERATKGELTWPGLANTTPDKVGERMVSLAQELKAYVA